MAPVQNGIQQYVKLLAHIQEEDEPAGAVGRPLAPPFHFEVPWRPRRVAQRRPNLLH